jgi:GNAT superfamily N-acetyltransferase
MPDLLVKLYELPSLEPVLEKCARSGVEIRRAIAPEKHLICAWATKHFNEGWASEIEVGFAQTPAGVFVATKNGKCVGFSCYDATCRGFFGPVGVDKTERGAGIGAALTLKALQAMRDVGYGYAVIGAAGPVDFYTRLCGATAIEGSVPGIYRGMLKASPSG